MDQRERFEAWYEQSNAFDRDKDTAAWLAWQAAEAAALERAADIAERKAGDCHTLGNAEEFRELAAYIRKLAAPVERGGEKS
jgi:hypothetical protein